MIGGRAARTQPDAWAGARAVRVTSRAEDATLAVTLATDAARAAAEFAETGDPASLPSTTSLLADVLAEPARTGLVLHHERFADETHATLYHPAALRAFRILFPAAPPAAAGPAA